MRILMLGNSFTFYNEMPKTLAKLTGAEVIANTRGGARLDEQLDENTEMGAETIKALEKEQWDFVVIQEFSNGPIAFKDSFFNSVNILCEKIRKAGAVPVLYATWAYKKGSEKMESMEMSYDEMYQQMYNSYHEASEQNNARIADVGKAFYDMSEKKNLYADDGFHPNHAGSKVAARLLAEVILQK